MRDHKNKKTLIATPYTQSHDGGNRVFFGLITPDDFLAILSEKKTRFPPRMTGYRVLRCWAPYFCGRAYAPPCAAL